MVDKKNKKILIFACPRTGTTIIQKILADLFSIPNLVEPFNNPELGFNPANPKIVNGELADLYKWTQEQTTGIMKLLAINLDYVNANKLLTVGNFDHIVIIERKNLVDCCISLFLAQTTRKYHFNEGDPANVNLFNCNIDFVNEWINMYKRYKLTLEQITNSNISMDVIYYEDFMNDQVQYVANVELQLSKMRREVFSSGKKMISLNLPYRELCVNYREVEEKIRKELC
jgi:hypothetical protein